MHNPKSSDKEELLTTTPAARELEVSSQRVIQLEQQGILKAIRTATGIRLFRRVDIERLKRERQEAKR